MSTFDGFIREIPSVKVDRFESSDASRRSGNVYFLSHAHQDHMKGLEFPAFASPVFCSEVTARILPVVHGGKYAHLRQCVRILSMYEVTPVTIDGGFTMNVTAFPASHCAGSTMFLFEFRGKRVLYTGDMRADESLMQEILQTSDVFCNAFGNMRVIDALYIDTTFCDPRMHAFPSKRQSIESLVTAISRRPLTTCFSLQLLSLGYEDLLLALARYFNTQIHVSTEQFAIYKAYASGPHTPPDTDMSHSITLSPTASTRFHFRCDCWRRDPTLVRIKATTMAFQPALARRRAVEPVPMIHDEPHYIHVLHSMHSSYAELREFVRAVRPHAVHACVLDPGSAFTSVHVLSAFDDLVRPEERKVVPVEQAGAGVVAALLGRSKSRAEILLEQLAGLSSGEGDERQRVMTQSLEEDEETAPLESSMGSFGYVIDEAGVDTQRTRLMADKEIISLQNVQLATLARLKLPVEEEILKEPLDSNDVSLKQGSIHLLPGTPKDADLAQDDATEPMSSHPASIELGPIQNAGAPILSQPAESSAVSHIDPVESCEGDVFGESDDEAAASVVFDNNAREILEVIAPVHGMHLKVDADETEGTQPADPVSTLIPDSLEPQRKASLNDTDAFLEFEQEPVQFALSKDEEMKILAYVDRASILIPDSLDSQRKSDWTDTRGTLESENLLAESSQKSDECIILDVHAPANTSQPCPLKEGSEHEDIIPSSQPASPASPASNSSSLVGQSVSRRVCDSAPSSPVLSVAQNSRKRQQPQSKELEVIDLTVSDEEETVLVLASPERPALLRRKRSGGESSSQAVKRVRSHESKCDPLDWVKGLSRQGSRLAAFSCDETQEGKLMETEVEERARHVRGGGRFVLACTNPFKENGS